MSRLYSYCLPCDDGAAPNPYWGLCTLVICKPAIRRTAQVGDWVVGTGAKHTRRARGATVDLRGHVIYAMRVSDKMPMEDYDTYVRRELPDKLPDWDHSDPRRRLGDAIYDFSGPKIAQRDGVHGAGNQETDLSGKFALLSDDFYYFGDRAIALPSHLAAIAQNQQGHRVGLNAAYVAPFARWLHGLGLRRGKLVGNPLLDLSSDEVSAAWCASCRAEADEFDCEEKQ